MSTTTTLLLHNSEVSLRALTTIFSAAVSFGTSIQHLAELRRLVKLWLGSHPEVRERVEPLWGGFYRPLGIFETWSGWLVMWRVVYWSMLRGVRDVVEINDPEEQDVVKMLQEGENAVAAGISRCRKLREVGGVLRELRFRRRVQDVGL